MNRVMRPIKQPAKYVIAVGVAAAALFGAWLMWSGDMPGTDSNSSTNRSTTGQVSVGREDSASASEANDGSAEPGGKSDSDPARAQSDGTVNVASGYFKPIPLPDEFAGMAEAEGPISEFHKNLEREPEDPEWALPLEHELADLLNELLDPSLVAVKLIECRSDSCEILAVGYGEQARKEWLELPQALYESGMLEKWFNPDGTGQFNGGCGAAEIGPGITGLNCQFSRADPQPPDTGDTGPFSLTAPYPDGVEFTLAPVANEFVPLFETNSEVYDFHRNLQTEAVDHSWAPFVENQIIEHFSAIPELESVNYHHIECRMTRCEVQLTIHDPQAVVAWVLESGNFANQPWHDLEFTIHNAPSNDDLIHTLWLLSRKTGN